MPAGSDVPDIAPPPGALELARQMDQQKIEYLTQRCDALRKENEVLKAKVEKSERDQHDFVSYFQKELEMKDAVLAELKEEAGRKDQEARNDLRNKCAAYEQQLSLLRERQQEVENALRLRIKILEEDLKMLQGYRENKAQVEAKIQDLTAEVEFLQEKREKEVADLERKFLMDKAQLQKDVEKQKEQIIAEAKADAENGLNAKTRQIWQDNKRFAEEIKFQSQMVNEMQEEKDKAEAENVVYRKELELAREKEKEYLMQLRQKTQAIHGLNKRLDELETAQVEAVKQFNDEKAKLRGKLKKAAEESSTDVEGMRTMIKVKNKELRHIKKLAQVVVDQRTEVEQFFLDTLEEVKRQIRKEREDKYLQELEEHNQKMREAARTGRAESFPRIRGRMNIKNFDMFAPASTSKLPYSMYDKVELKKLTWEDRERVLRMLFAKINAMQGGGLDPLPGHPLEGKPHAPAPPSTMKTSMKFPIGGNQGPVMKKVDVVRSTTPAT